MSDELAQFLNSAKDAGEPTVVMGFSSMPVPRDQIIRMALEMITKCKCQPRIIALVGPRDLGKEKLSKNTQQLADAKKAEGRLFEAAGAPFGYLFDAVDCIIMHGGLGTTAETLRSGKPCMVTGVLLMDQRFWGKRVSELGVGPPAVHVNDFLGCCVKQVDDCLAPGSVYQQRAVEVASQIQGRTPDGVEENVEAVVRLAQIAKPARLVRAQRATSPKEAGNEETMPWSSPMSHLDNEEKKNSMSPPARQRMLASFLASASTQSGSHDIMPHHEDVSEWVASIPKFSAFASNFAYTEWEQLAELTVDDLKAMDIPGPAAVPLCKLIAQLALDL